MALTNEAMLLKSIDESPKGSKSSAIKAKYVALHRRHHKGLDPSAGSFVYLVKRLRRVGVLAEGKGAPRRSTLSATEIAKRTLEFKEYQAAANRKSRKQPTRKEKLQLYESEGREALAKRRKFSSKVEMKAKQREDLAKEGEVVKTATGAAAGEADARAAFLKQALSTFELFIAAPEASGLSSR